MDWRSSAWPRSRWTRRPLAVKWSNTCKPSAKGDPLSLPCLDGPGRSVSAGQRYRQHAGGFQADAPGGSDKPKAAGGAVQILPAVGTSGDSARAIADSGLKLDPYNADLYDLKSNACLFLSDFKCAVDALETMYATDSTKADTLFFTKISAAAAEGENPDKVRLLKWSQTGIRKYPDNPTLLGYLNKGYSMTGQTDSVVAVTNRIIAKDTTETGVVPPWPLLRR